MYLLSSSYFGPGPASLEHKLRRSWVDGVLDWYIMYYLKAHSKDSNEQQTSTCLLLFETNEDVYCLLYNIQQGLISNNGFMFLHASFKSAACKHWCNKAVSSCWMAEPSKAAATHVAKLYISTWNVEISVIWYWTHNNLLYHTVIVQLILPDQSVHT